MDLEEAGTRAVFAQHDRDASFTQAFDAVFQATGIRVIRSAVQAPRMNSVMERWIGSCRRELLDRTLVWNLRHLMTVLREYEDFYTSHRPHRACTRPRRYGRCQTASPTWIISGPAPRPRRWRHPRIPAGGMGYRHSQRMYPPIRAPFRHQR